MRLIDGDALEKRLEYLWNISDDSDFANKEVWHALSEAPTIDVPDRKIGKWIVVKRHEHYPSGKPYEQVQCPFCKRIDNNGDGSFRGYCGARLFEKGDSDADNNSQN